MTTSGHFLLPGVFGILLFTGCQTVSDDRIPNMPVNINLGDTGLWNTYGVSGFGTNRNFILDLGMHIPAGFPYSQTSATGFGGVLLISGMDPFTTTTDIPLAYDLACPVERNRNIRVYIDNDTYVAVCNQCNSTYDVTMGGGSPLSGPAASGKYKYGLRKYNCYPTGQGGFIITN